MRWASHGIVATLVVGTPLRAGCGPQPCDVRGGVVPNLVMFAGTSRREGGEGGALVADGALGMCRIW